MDSGVAVLDAPEVPKVEPRRYGPEGPEWDTTDEIYITYDEDGERAIVTTGAGDIWSQEHSYQRTGSNRYAALRSLGGRVGNLVRIRSGLSTPNRTSVRDDRDGNDPWRGPGRGTRDGSPDNGESAERTSGHRRDHAQGSRIPDRSERGVRSHRHCAGCTGHGRVLRSGWGVFGRGVAGWFVGWLAIFFGGIELTLSRYFILTALGFAAAMIFRPTWREFADAEGRRTKGGKR